jgi:hypothetical protein
VPPTHSASVDRSSSTPYACVDLTLPVQRQVIAIFGDDDMCQQAGAGNATFDRPRWRRRLHQCFAACATELGTNMPDHPETGRDEFQLLGNVFADRLQCPTAVRTLAGRRGIVDGVARQMVWQRLAHASGPCCGQGRPRRRRILGFVGLEFLELEFQLLDLQVKLLGFAAEFLAMQCGDLDLQALDHQLAGAQGRFQ